MPHKRSAKQRPRELRRRILLPAHIRTSAGWGQASILNISSRGLLIYASGPAPKDNRVELRQGDHSIAARVVWRKGQRLGLATEERLPLEDIVTLGISPALQLMAVKRPSREQRSGCAFAESRQHSRAMEFVSVLMIGAFLSLAAVDLVAQAFARPISRVAAVLTPQAEASVDSR
jgi:hypothetical protein